MAGFSSAEIINNIKRYVSINGDEEKAFTNIIQPKFVKRQDLIEQPGFVCRKQSYVLKGTLRSYVIDSNGNEHTIQFAIEDWFISDFSSYIFQRPARIYVQALVESQLLQIEYTEVEKLCVEFPVFEKYFRLISQKAFSFAQNRILSNLENTAEERYISFLNMYPEIVRRVPQYMLASYLGMSPEFLSKIRAKIINS